MKLSKDFWQGWSIGKESGDSILKLLNKHKPKKILDLGSGYSTVLFGLWAKEHAAEVISLEQSQLYLAKTRKLLQQYGLDVQVTYAPLTETPYGLFYKYDFPDEIDFVLIDGPAWSNNGRGASFYAIQPHLSKNYVVYVDDAYREQDRQAREAWQQQFGFKITPNNTRSVIITP